MLTFGELHLEPQRSELALQGFPAVLEYLRRRGISGQLIDDLGIRILPAGELIQRARQSVVRVVDDRLAAVFPHFDIKGDFIDWWSARLVETGLRPAIISFASLIPSKRGKMFCPPNEPPRAYLPPTLDWTALERGAKIYIHESAIKAVNGALCDTWSVGLNGVWGWTSRKHNIALVQELKDLPWKAKELDPIIVFDSNAADNWDVQNAIARLAAKLLEVTGREARHLLLPKAKNGAHQGFDDYVAEVGVEEASRFLANEPEAISVSEIELLKIQLNSEVAVVRSLGRIATQADGTLMSRAIFTEVNYAHYTANVEDRDGNLRPVNVPKLWLADARRVEVDTLTYMPGAERIQDGSLNLWRGMALEPAEGDARRWLELLERNITDEGLRTWVLQWMAYPLRHLGAKLNTYVHLFGPPGSGKQALIYPLMRIYGEANAIVIGKDQIQSQFNSVYAHKQFVNLDELHGGGDSLGIAVANRIKMLVTGPRMVVNTKGQPEYSTPNCANVVSTANYSDAIRLDDDDRRAAVVRFGSRGDKRDRAYWETYFHWVAAEGASAVFDYLLGVDLAGFDPAGWAPMTDEKTEVTRSTRKVDEQWVNDLYDNPDQVLPPILSGRCLMSGAELAQYAFADDPAGITPSKKNILGIKMHSAGFPKIEIKIEGRKERYWIIRKREEVWDGERARKHLASFKVKGAK